MLESPDLRRWAPLQNVWEPELRISSGRASRPWKQAIQRNTGINILNTWIKSCIRVTVTVGPCSTSFIAVMHVWAIWETTARSRFRSTSFHRRSIEQIILSPLADIFPTVLLLRCARSNVTCVPLTLQKANTARQPPGPCGWRVRCGEVKSCPSQRRTRLENIAQRCATEVSDLESRAAHFCAILVLHTFKAKFSMFTYPCGKSKKWLGRAEAYPHTHSRLCGYSPKSFHEPAGLGRAGGPEQRFLNSTFCVLARQSSAVLTHILEDEAGTHGVICLVYSAAVSKRFFWSKDLWAESDQDFLSGSEQKWMLAVEGWDCRCVWRQFIKSPQIWKHQ